MLANLTLKSRIFLSYLVYLVFLSIPGAIAPAYFYLNAQKFAHQTPEISQNLLANQLSEAKIKLQESILGYVSTKDQVFLESYDVNLRQLNNAIAVWEQRKTDMPLESANSGQKILLLAKELNDLNQYILASIASGKTDQAIRAIGADESRQIWLALTAEIERVRMAEIHAESLKIQAVNTSMRQLVFLGALATLIFSLLAIALGLVMADRILGKAKQLLEPIVKSSGAIVQEMNDHQQSGQNQAQILSLTTPQLQELREFCQLSRENSTSIDRDFAELSIHLSEVRSQLQQIKSLREISDHLVDYSKKLSLNISLKIGHKDTENYRMFLFLNTELKNITNYAQKLDRTLNQIVGESANLASNISFYAPSWGGNNQYPISPDLISHDGFTSPSELSDRLLILCEQIKIQISQLALSSQQQAANSEQLLDSKEQLEEIGMTMACGIAETTIQIQKLHQLAWHLKSFLGDRAV